MSPIAIVGLLGAVGLVGFVGYDIYKAHEENSGLTGLLNDAESNAKADAKRAESAIQTGEHYVAVGASKAYQYTVGEVIGWL